MAISIGQYAPVFLLGGFCGGSEVKASPCNAGDLALIPGLGRSPGERNGYPLQYSGLENSIDYIVHGVAKSQKLLSDFHFSLSCIGEGNSNPLQCHCLRIPGTGEPRGLPSMESHRVGHD